MAGKLGDCMINSPILHAQPQRQPDVNGSLYHLMCISSYGCLELCLPELNPRVEFLMPNDYSPTGDVAQHALKQGTANPNWF